MASSSAPQNSTTQHYPNPLCEPLLADESENYVNPLDQRLLKSRPATDVYHGPSFVTTASHTATTLIKKGSAKLQEATQGLLGAGTEQLQTAATEAYQLAGQAYQRVQEVGEQTRQLLVEAKKKMNGISELASTNPDNLLSQLMHTLTNRHTENAENLKHAQQLSKKQQELNKPMDTLARHTPRVLEPFTFHVQGFFRLSTLAIASASTQRNQSVSVDLSGFPELLEALKQKLGQNTSLTLQELNNQSFKITLPSVDGQNEVFYIILTQTEKGIGKEPEILEQGWRETPFPSANGDYTITQTGTFKPIYAKKECLTMNIGPNAINNHHQNEWQWYEISCASGSFLSEGEVTIKYQKRGDAQPITLHKQGTFEPPAEAKQVLHVGREALKTHSTAAAWNNSDINKLVKNSAAREVKALYGLEALKQGTKTITKPNGDTETRIAQGHQTFTPIAPNRTNNRQPLNPLQREEGGEVTTLVTT